MALLRLAELTYTDVEALDRRRTVPVLPVGAVEAHGPHLPLSTDVIIAEAMVEAAAAALTGDGIDVLVLPTFAYTPAAFANGFAGTVSIRPRTATALVEDVARSVAGRGFRWLAVANAHLDPANIGALRDGLAAVSGLAAIFPDVTRKPWALRLTDEFRSGACHAGRYEGSIVLAARPELVRSAAARSLPANPVSLSEAIGAGLTSFEAAGGERAYFGDPAAASAAEGRRTIEVLGGILADAIREALSQGSLSGQSRSE